MTGPELTQDQKIALITPSRMFWDNRVVQNIPNKMWNDLLPLQRRILCRLLEQYRKDANRIEEETQ